MTMIATAFLAMVLVAQPGNTPPAPSSRAAAQKTREKKRDNKSAPDADLIGFLGDYEDAADGLDPIGLSEPVSGKNATPDEKKKDGHGP